jgi:uncharacterized protein HemX
MWSAIAGIAALGLAIFAWWAKQNDSKTKERESRKQEIKDAVKSGDISRIHSIIDRLRGK